MAADYPGTLPSFTTKTDKVDLVAASHINDVQLEVVAIGTELGTDVAGSATDLKTRLAVSIADTGAIANDTSYPGAPVEGQMFYRSDEEKFYGRRSADWADLASDPLSNVLFSFCGMETGNNAQFYIGTDITLAIGAFAANYAYWVVNNGNTYVTIIPVFKWKKIAGVDTVSIHCRIWAGTDGSNETANLKVDIGGANGNVSSSANQETPEYKTFDIDVSGLTNGNLYDVTIQLQETSNGTTAMCSSIIAIGSA